MRTTVGLTLLVLVSAPASAAFLEEEVSPGVYLVSYERGKMTSGGLLDTAKKARRKLEKRSAELCGEKGFTHMRMLTLGEIAADETLTKVWQLAGGVRDSREPSGWGGTHHESAGMVRFSKEPGEGMSPCRDVAKAKDE